MSLNISITFRSKCWKNENTNKMTMQHFQQPAFCKRLIYVPMICNHKIAFSAYSLEIGKTKHLICLQFRYTNQTFIYLFIFANFSNYSKDRHFITNGSQNVIFGDILEIWRKLLAFFINFFSKVILEWEQRKYRK